MSNETLTDQQYQNVRAAYQHLCSSYHAIDDFRAKLLGFLPLVSGVGVFLLLNDAFTDPAKRDFAQQFLGPIGVFGFVITLGLFSYEIYGIKKCHALIEAGKQIEGKLGINGQFKNRPREVFRVMNEPFAAGVIYPAVLAVWTFLALVFVWPFTAVLAAILVFIVFFVGTLNYNIRLEKGQ